MAALQIPPPNATGYWHFTYRITDETGRWYGGKRSTKKHPSLDRYIGSGNWIKNHPDRKLLKREIIAFFASSAEVFNAEAELVTWEKVYHDPLCMNLRDGGEGVTVEAALLRYSDPVQRANNLAMLKRMHADPKVSAKRSASAIQRYKDPEEHTRNIEHMRRIASDPALLAKAQASRDTPKWRANVLAALELMRSTQEWKDAQAAGMERAKADPVWQEAMATKNKLMALDPKWLENSITRLLQARAKRAAIRGVICISLNGKEVPLADACREAGVSYVNAMYRRKVGRPQSEWLSPPAKCDAIFIVLNGERVQLRKACRQAGISYATADARRRAGWPESEWLVPPTIKRPARQT